ncbi:MAG TPA: kelch repeat-containing protein, partial [Bacillota bacterium]|nr:kelch repeat-containing protein [Bacillota bacterium]
MRFRKILITVSILICVLALFSLASVNTDRGVIYGPENFDNETGGPISFERKIIVEYEVRDGILHIENGKQIREKLDPEPNKPWMISNRKHGWFSNLFTKCKNFILYIINSRLSREKAVKGIIKLNGQVIANEKQFNHFIDTIDIPVKLLDGENLLEISFIGSKHAGITAYLDAVPVLDVNLQAEPQTGYTPLAVNLKATVNPGAKVSGYQWDFNNDGIIDQETTEAQTSYVYRQPGSYEPRVIVTHVCGLQVNGATGPIQVERLLFNVKLESQPLSGLAPLIVAFTATIDQAQIQPVTYDWDFNNDGVIDQTTTTGNTTHTYQEAGTYRAKVAVTDVVGTMAEATTPVITVYQLSVPANFQAVPGPYKITLFWDPVDQATGYELEIDGAVVDTGGQVSYTYRDVTPNVRHSFRVRAKNANGTSLWSEAIFSSTEPLSFNCRVDAQPLEGLVPLIVTFTAAIDNPEVEPASYAWDFDNDGVTDQTTTEGNASYKYQNARIYRAKVVVTDIAGTTGAGTSQPITVYDLAVPENVRATAGDYIVTISWDAVTHATGYDLEADGVVIDTEGKTTYKYRATTPGQQHEFRVRAKNGGTTGLWSAKVYGSSLGWLVRSSMPTARGYGSLAAAAVNNKIYAIGGSNGTSLSTVEEYDPFTNSWLTKKPMNTARYGLALTELNGKLYAIGGISSSYLNTMEEYDPATDTWKAKASMKNTRYSFGAAVVNGKIYAVGGSNGSTRYNSMEEYDPKANSWTAKASMVTARLNHGVAAVNGKIYVIGGNNGSAVINTVEEYNPATDTWTYKANMPTARQAFGVTVVDNKIYVIGGYNGSAYLNTVEEYDPATDTWKTRLNMMTPRNGLGAASVNGRIFAIGGYNGSNLNRVEEYNLKLYELPAPVNVKAEAINYSTITVNWDTVFGASGYDLEVDGTIINLGASTSYTHRDLLPDIVHTYRVRSKNNTGISEWVTVYEWIYSWKVKADLPTARYYLGAAAWNNKVYAIGGSNGVALGTVEEYDIVTDTWTSKASLKTARYGAGVEAINGKIYAAGGMGSSYLTSLEEFNPATNTWTTKASMKTARSNAGVAVLNGRLYVVGGYNSTNGYLSTVEEYDPETDTWATKASLKAGRNYLGVAAVNGKLYAIGGYNGSYLNTVEEYDPVANTWTTKSALPTARYAWVEVADNKIYAIGGYNGNYLNTMEEYNPVTDTWTTSKLPMPTARNGFGITATNGKIYIIGGTNGSGLNRVEEFTWEQFDLWAPTNVLAKITDPYTIAVSWDSVLGATSYDIEIDGAIIDAGNNTTYVHSSLTRDILHTYRVRAKNGNRLSDWTTVYKCIASWKVKADLPTARYYLGATAWNNKVYAVGGTNGSALATVEEYDIVTNTWTSKASLKTARYGAGVEAINGKIYAVGGMSSSSSYFNTLEEYDPATNSWTS